MKPNNRLFLYLAIGVLLVLFFFNGFHEHLLLMIVGIFSLIILCWWLAYFRKQQKKQRFSSNVPSSLEQGVFVHAHNRFFQEIVGSCTDCGACQTSCRFLSHYGTPKQMARQFDFSSPRDQGIAYECSLCGLCTAICPEKLDLPRLFLTFRQSCVENQVFDEKAYRVILGYEKRGRSPLFSWYGLPESCDTVFFPGCTLPGTRPAATMSLFKQLQESIPGLGIVLDCCAKPSHDLGRSQFFSSVFKDIRDALTAHGIRQILTACPNCTKIFKAYGKGFTVRTVYEVLQEKNKFPSLSGAGMTVTVHDPCAARDDHLVHQAVRNLLSDMGHTIEEMKHNGCRTLCCGEGGTVSVANPGFAAAWTSQRGRETNGHLIATYCAGCSGLLNVHSPTFHIADLLYDPQAVSDGKPKVAKAPFTYWNRFRIKHKLKNEMQHHLNTK